MKLSFTNLDRTYVVFILFCNNNNEINSSNKNSTINKDNVISPSPSQISKETAFILGDSMVMKLNRFLLTRNKD